MRALYYTPQINQVTGGLAGLADWLKSVDNSDARRTADVLGAPPLLAYERPRADVAELVDALDLGSSAERRGGSSPLIRTSTLGPATGS